MFMLSVPSSCSVVTATFIKSQNRLKHQCPQDIIHELCFRCSLRNSWDGIVNIVSRLWTEKTRNYDGSVPNIGQEIFLFCEVSRPALVPVQPPKQ